MTPTIPAEPRIENLIALVDTREQDVLDLAPLQQESATLTTGDYSLKHLEHVVALERKSLPDFLACCGVERPRFQREVDRLIAYPVRALLIEATWPDLERGGWRSQITPAAAIGSALGWIAAGLPVLMCGDHERAGKFAARLLFLTARRRWRENRGLLAGIMEAAE